jgi:hypothetical protein
MDSKKMRPLRSQEWFGKANQSGFIHRSWLKNQGYPEDLFDGRPVIGTDALQRSFPRTGGVRQTRRLRSRRFSAGVPGDVAG